ncbi:MAG: SRPBCC family protein, partial [Bacteroidetes bacterium]|nr:SRPBCC family protein [Bacteroidota bacterium]
MTEIKSETVSISDSAEHKNNFLSDFNNFGKLMPEQVINWQSGIDQCSFTIKGMTDINLTMAEKVPFNMIKYSSGNKSPFS